MAIGSRNVGQSKDLCPNSPEVGRIIGLVAAIVRRELVADAERNEHVWDKLGSPLSHILAEFQGRDTFGAIRPASGNNATQLADCARDNGGSICDAIERSRVEYGIFVFVRNGGRVGQFKGISVVQCGIIDDGLRLATLKMGPFWEMPHLPLGWAREGCSMPGRG